MTSDPMQAIVASMPFAGYIGLRVIDATRHQVIGEVTVEADKCTAGNIAHGGFLMTLADCVGAIATVLRAMALPISVGRRLQVWQTRVETPEGKLISLTTQTQLNL